MDNEDYIRLVQTMNAVRPEDDAAVLVRMRGEDIKVSTFGHPRPLTALKQWLYKWLGGR